MAKAKKSVTKKKVVKASSKKKVSKKIVVKRKGKKKGIIEGMVEEEDTIDEKLIKEEEKIEKSIFGKTHHYFHKHLDNYESKHGRWIEGTLFALNFFVIILFVIETHNISDQLRSTLHIVESSIISVFVVEYAARMWVAKRKVKHFFNIYSIIDLLSIIPILILFANLSFLRIFRILRLFRMLRVLRFQRMFKAKNTMFGQLSDTQLIIIRIVLTVFTIIFVSSAMIWTVENKINPGQLGTIWDAMYFAIVTLATVGYGDVTPISIWGKLITVAMILAGIALIPWQLGKLIKIVFMSANKKKINCPKCKLDMHEPDSTYCKRCGSKLKKGKILEEESA